MLRTVESCNYKVISKIKYKLIDSNLFQCLNYPMKKICDIESGVI